MKGQKMSKRIKNALIVSSCCIYISIVMIAFLLIGCAALDTLFDPNTASAVQQGTNAIGTITTSAGFPWGWMIVTAGSIFSALATIYRNYRNKQEAANKYQAIEITTESIVKAIEAVANTPTTDGKTIGNVVKAEVKSKLEGQEWYEIGKAIISGLKK